MPKIKKVALVAEKISDRVILLSKIWKKKGYQVCLIYKETSPLFNDCTAIDHKIQINLAISLILELKKIKPRVVHYFCYGPDKFGLLLSLFNIKFILDYKDLFFNVLISGHRKWRLLLEKHTIKQALFITHRDNQIFNYINVNKITLDNSKLIYIPEYFEKSKNFEEFLLKKIKSNKIKAEIKGVMTGGYIREKGNYSADGISVVLKNLINQGIVITIIGENSNISELNSYSLDEKLIGDELQDHPNLIFKKMMTQNQFEEELLEYDFAIHLTNIDFDDNLLYKEFNSTEHFKYSGSARIISYIKANLPILMSNRFEYNHERLAGTNFALTFDKNINYFEFINNSKEQNLQLTLLRQRDKFELLGNIDNTSSRL